MNGESRGVQRTTVDGAPIGVLAPTDEVKLVVLPGTELTVWLPWHSMDLKAAVSSGAMDMGLHKHCFSGACLQRRSAQ